MTGVAVWSFMNERRQWSPYEPSVSREIENVFSTSSNGQSSLIVNLGTISPNLSCYQVDVVNMRQLQMYSGSTRPVQRSVCPPWSALANGFVWEFEGDQPSHWIIYDIDTMTVLEEEYTKFTQSGAPTILDLQQSTLRLPYIIDFGNYTQTRVETGKVRKIQRRPLNQPYSPVPVLTNSAPSLPSSSSSQGNGAMSSNPAKQKTSKSRKHRNQPYTVKSGSNHAIQAPAQGPSQNAGAQMNFTNVMPYQQQQGLQLQQQQLLQQQQQQQQQQQMQNSQGRLTRSRIQTTGQGTGQSLVVPALQQQQQPQTQHPAMPHQLPHHQLLQQHQQQQQHQHPSQPMLYQPQPLHGMMGIPAQLLHPQGQGPLPAFPYPPVINHQPSSLGQMPQQQPASSAQQQSQLPGSSSSSTQAHPPVALPSVSKITIGKTKKSKPKTGLEVLGRYMTQINTDLDKHDCCICYDKLSEASSYGEGQPDAHDAVKLGQCGHMFHKLCLLEMHNSIHKDDSLQCPSCKTIYGEKTGNCPPGYMQWKVVQGLHLAGYEDCDAIVVSYHISPGVQGPEHPQPGQRYSTRGFPRQGFIPNCDQGRKVLKLLIEAFKRRLMFTIGTSHTTGESNTVVWNEIHHKTEPHGNYSGHGFPDPKYLDNALLELAAHGVTEDCLS